MEAHRLKAKNKNMKFGCFFFDQTSGLEVNGLNNKRVCGLFDLNQRDIIAKRSELFLCPQTLQQIVLGIERMNLQRCSQITVQCVKEWPRYIASNKRSSQIAAQVEKFARRECSDEIRAQWVKLRAIIQRYGRGMLVVYRKTVSSKLEIHPLLKGYTINIAGNPGDNLISWVPQSAITTISFQTHLHFGKVQTYLRNIDCMKEGTDKRKCYKYWWDVPVYSVIGSKLQLYDATKMMFMVTPSFTDWLFKNYRRSGPEMKATKSRGTSITSLVEEYVFWRDMFMSNNDLSFYDAIAKLLASCGHNYHYCNLNANDNALDADLFFQKYNVATSELSENDDVIKVRRCWRYYIRAFRIKERVIGRACAWCGKRERRSSEITHTSADWNGWKNWQWFKICSNCEWVAYCGRKCQAKDWNYGIHKRICNKVKRNKKVWSAWKW